jgi:hypothetical protein
MTHEPARVVDRREQNTKLYLPRGDSQLSSSGESLRRDAAGAILKASSEKLTALRYGLTIHRQS